MQKKAKSNRKIRTKGSPEQAFDVCDYFTEDAVYYKAPIGKYSLIKLNTRYYKRLFFQLTHFVRRCQRKS